MKKQSPDKIIQCYNDTAHNYAAERIDELSKKHFDRLLLKEFALANKNKGICADFGCGPSQTTKLKRYWNCLLTPVLRSLMLWNDIHTRT
jgi:hypothetical protein